MGGGDREREEREERERNAPIHRLRTRARMASTTRKLPRTSISAATKMLRRALRPT